MGNDRGHQGEQGPRRLPHSVYADTLALIGYLIDHDNFAPCSREQMAHVMGWTMPGSGPVDIPNGRRVKDVCAFTKDKAATDDFGGMVIVYAPNEGGMVLVDPGQAQPVQHLIHLVLGDAQRQQQHKTENQRRLTVWQQAGRAAANAGDLDLARVCWRAENEVEQTGIISGTTTGDIWKAARDRGYV